MCHAIHKMLDNIDINTMTYTFISRRSNIYYVLEILIIMYIRMRS